MSRDPDRRCSLGRRTDACTPGCVDREDRVSIITDHDVVEVAMNGLLVWILLIVVLLLVVGGVISLIRGKEPP